ncbi:MAG: ABC transporter ATP-binding protein, partial [Alsobacter sp.]
MGFLELKGLRKVYGPAVAVDTVDLSIEKGQLVCLLGPSGCGKTTTLRLVAGFMEPTAGTIVVGGRTVSAAGMAEPPERRNMSMIFQSYALWPHMTVYENVAYGLKLRKLDKAQIRARVDKILAVAKLGHLSERYP